MLDLEVVAVAGEPLRIDGNDDQRAGGRRSSRPRCWASPSRGPRTWICSRPSSAVWAGRSTSSRDIEATIEGRPMVPMSLLNQLRRELVARLDLAAAAVPARTIAPQPVLPELLEPILAERDRQRQASHDQPAPVELSVLCRRTDQIEAALRLGVSTIYADYQDIKQYAEAVAAVRRGQRRRRRSTWRPRASRSPARPTSSASWPGKGPTESWYATRGA